MKELYTSLLARFAAAEALFTTESLKPIAHIDRFKGQYLNPELHPVYPVPALFFKFNITWEDKGQNTQRGAGILEVHTELENYHESGSNSLDQAEALKDYDYLTIIHSLIQGFQDYSRISTDEDENPSNTNVTITRYSFTVDDDSTERYSDWIKEKLDDLVLIRKPVPTAPAVTDQDKYVV
jgi:hypothetical protein